MSDLYTWLKAIHVAAALLFVGGLLAESLVLGAIASVQPSDRRRLAGLLRRWERRITTPAMLLVWTLGLVLALRGGWFRMGWLPAKLAFVAMLSALHGVSSGSVRRIANGTTDSPPKTAIELIALGALLIACLAVAKPF